MKVTNIFLFIFYLILLLNSEAKAQDMIVYDENKNLEIVFKYNPYENFY